MKRSELYELIDRALADGGHEALSGVRNLRDELSWIEQRAVQRARADGLNWAEIGRVLGVARQTVHDRFGTSLPPFRPDRRSEYERAEAAFIALRDGKRTGRNPELDDEVVAW
jgi:hypothetical protein